MFESAEKINKIIRGQLPDATYSETGTMAGKFVYGDFVVCPACGFYTDTKQKKTFKVPMGSWHAACGLIQTIMDQRKPNKIDY